jgi:DNA-binding response OmpR family regulator
MDRRKTILVIDDDPAITRVLCCALEEEYDVQIAFSGEEGYAVRRPSIHSSSSST